MKTYWGGLFNDSVCVTAAGDHTEIPLHDIVLITLNK